MSESRTCLVVPCFNEELRLDEVKYETLINSGLVTLLFVDDCSTDQTKNRVQGFASKWPNCVAVISQVKNQGKGEAVRVGLLGAISMGNQRVGFMDADFAVPPEEVLRFINESNKMDEKLVFLGSRVKLLGSPRLFGHVNGQQPKICPTWVGGTEIFPVPPFWRQVGRIFLR